VIDELAPSIEKKSLKVIFNFDGSIPKLKVDQSLMRIIFQNLISNAVKYTPEEGNVEVNIGYKNEQKKTILISVKDNGYGIPAHQQDQIFQKLFRADNVKSKVAEGTGLGLYIVKSIVDHSGGSISFHSKEGQGTTCRRNAV
jgi:signal transduction histidine kinase